MSNHVAHAVHGARSSSSNGSKPTPDSKHQITTAIPQESIAQRAYEKYVARGRVHGFDQQDWSEATRELLAETLAH